MTLSLLEAAGECPAREAIITPETTLTFGELAAPVRARMADIRAALGEFPGPVALAAEPRVETVIRIYALMELGETFLPVSPRLTARERETLLAAVRPRFFMEFAAPAAGTGRPWSDSPRRAAEEEALALVFTAGSSGRPRAAILSRRAFLASARASAANLGWREDDRWLLAMPMNHVGGLSVLTRSLIARRPVVLLDRPAPGEMAEAVREHRVTLLSLVPAALERLLDAPESREGFPSLRAVLVGGAHAPAALISRARAAGIPALTTYGLTECCSQAATQPPEDARREAGGDSGRALPGIEIRVIQERIQLRGASLFSGYFPPEEPRSDATGDGWFETGDLGRLDEEGRLHVFGRADETLVTGGEKVHPGEVEEALMAFPGVAAACVFGIPDPTWGVIVAAALHCPEAPPDAARLGEHLRRSLAPWKRPRRIALLPEFPLTSAGKTDRSAIRRDAAARLREFL